MQIVIDNLCFCEDCMVAAVNNDYSGIDYHYPNPEEAEARVKQIQTGLEKWGWVVPHFGEDEGVHEGHDTCDCCGGRWYGDWYCFAVLG